MNDTIRLNTLIKPSFDQNLLNISKNSIASLMGHLPMEGEDHVMEVIDALVSDGKNLIEPMGGYIITKIETIDNAKGILTINGIDFHIGKIVTAQLRKADYVAWFLCSIGKKVETKSKQLMDSGDLLEGYTLDLFGSEAAESLASIIHHSVESVAKNAGLNITNRFSPGYCNWDVAEQFKLFSIIPDGHFNISLTESALMNPVKSVSGIIGIGKNATFSPYTCSKCDDKNCIYRDKKLNQNNH